MVNQYLYGKGRRDAKKQLTCPAGKPLEKHGYLNRNDLDLPTLRFMCEEKAVALCPKAVMSEQEMLDFYSSGDAWFANGMGMGRGH